jgi:hypothetical protein
MEDQAAFVLKIHVHQLLTNSSENANNNNFMRGGNLTNLERGHQDVGRGF